jgi:modulator of FtsH protease
MMSLILDDRSLGQKKRQKMTELIQRSAQMKGKTMRSPYELPFGAGATTAVRSGLLSKVAGLLAFSMAFTAAGAWLGTQLPGLGLPAIIGVLILSLVLSFARNVPGLNLILLYLLTTLMGIALGGIIEEYLVAGAGVIVVEAGATTAVLSVGLSVYAWTTKRDFSDLGSKLFIAVLGLIAVSIVSIFVQATFLEIIIGLAGSIIFSLYLVYQIQQVKNAEDTLGNAIILAVGIYLSIINIFLSLLRLFTAVQGGGRRS